MTTASILSCFKLALPTHSSVVAIRRTLVFSTYVPSASTTENERKIDADFVPERNADYKDKAYWDFRFQRERLYEWLGTFANVRDGMQATGIDFTALNKRVLIVGCGNSSFSHDLSVTCPSWEIVSIDFSAIVIENMKRLHPELTWIVEDMTKMTSLAEESFDYVLDKAAMDALVADEGSSWDPSESSKQSVDDMVANCLRVLKSGGKFSLVSFQPVHFRRRHVERAIEKCTLSVPNWDNKIQIKNCENPNKGTEFSVFTLSKF